MTSVIYIDNQGNIRGLANDILDKLSSLGPKKVNRVSNVEFDENSQCWVAIGLSGETIAAGKSRSEVIAAEQAFFNTEIEKEFATQA
jgi:hypothetical protein